ncbi:hypothetical protein CBM2585_B80222 [Cupriavidus taiwanensis]|nr:hypothetical protein CBM2585_B80222 [Cupriavidus taiwanensis]
MQRKSKVKVLCPPMAGLERPMKK